MIAQKHMVISVFICIDLNIIQTLPSCLQDLKSVDKKPRLRLNVLSRSLNSVNTRDSVCIIHVKHEQCIIMKLSIIHMRISVQRKVLITELINAISTTSAELSGPKK